MPAEESTLKTLGFAAAVAFVCSLMVTTAVHWLRPRQAALASVEYDRVIIEAAGLAGSDEPLTDSEIVSRFLQLQARAVDLETDAYSNDVDPLTYDFRALTETQERPRYMPVYALERGGSLERLILPVYGRGMWSTIQGVIALGADLDTIAAVSFYEHGETPGIGDRIEDPGWLARWRGKRVFDPSGTVCFTVRRGAGDDPCGVDAITGATVTSSSVGAMIRDWFGPTGYGPFLMSLREASSP